jgi:hypothetical protein
MTHSTMLGGEESVPACEITNAAPFIGEVANADLGEVILKATKSLSLRWSPPRTGMTRDYRHDRVTVHYDDQMIVTKIICG